MMLEMLPHIPWSSFISSNSDPNRVRRRSTGTLIVNYYHYSCRKGGEREKDKRNIEEGEGEERGGEGEERKKRGGRSDYF
jgi:hypothetical protein